MKPWMLNCAASFSLLFAMAASAGANKTTRLGQIDSVTDSSFIHLLDASGPEQARRLPVVSRTAEQLASRSLSEGAQWLPYVQQASLKLTSMSGQYFEQERAGFDTVPAGDDFETYLMLGVAAGLVAVHLRRKQKSLQQRPLAEVMYR